MASNVSVGIYRENRKIVIDENIAPLMKNTFEAYATGNFTLRQLCAKCIGLDIVQRRDF